jgi:hypothetical protein
MAKTRNPPTAGPQAKLQKVSIADSFEARPVSSALDHSARRDPGGMNFNLARNQSRSTSQSKLTPCSDILKQGKTITSSANLYGRF